ncbi:MAG: Hpt domain-containing protein, partial [Planctomycetes bacterium]|nr:Hpt domain-containing protein [Planctomycetota bacterium]
IDASALDELREYGPEVLGELIDIFLEDTPNRLDELWKAVECGDAHGTEQNAHALKSSCAQLGALELSELCKKLEMLGRSGDLHGADLLAQQARTEFADVRTALEAEKANAG